MLPVKLLGIYAYTAFPMTLTLMQSNNHLKTQDQLISANPPVPPIRKSWQFIPCYFGRAVTGRYLLPYTELPQLD